MCKIDRDKQSAGEKAPEHRSLDLERAFQASLEELISDRSIDEEVKEELSRGSFRGKRPFRL